MESHQLQQGAALFIALIILLIVSLMGVSAMRGSILGERMAFNSQAREMSFQAAETSINGVIATARENNALLGDLVGSLATRIHCIDAVQQLVDGACGNSSTFDSRSVLWGQAASVYERQRLAFENDTSSIVDYQFSTIGSGGFVSSIDMPFTDRNRQEWRKLGPPGLFEVSDPSRIGMHPPQQQD